MKTRHLIQHLAAAALLGGATFAQTNALEEKPYVPSASVVKGTVAALSDASEEVAALAVRALADWREAAAAADVAKLLTPDTPTAVRIEALQYFARLGPKAKPHVAEVVKQASDPDPNIRAAVLTAVFESQASAEHVDAIRKLLDDTRSDVRSAAARCLGQAGKAAASHRKALLDALSKAGTEDFKAAALRALAQIGGLTGEDIDLITPLVRDRDAEVRIAAWGAALKGSTAAKTAGAITEEKLAANRAALAPFFDAEPPEVKAAIAEEISGDKAAVQTYLTGLVKLIRTGAPEAKASALRTLGKGGEAVLDELPLIVEQAKAPDSIVRAAAISALGSLGAAAVKPNIPVIANALLDQSDLVRDEALLALPAGGDALRNFPYRVRDVFPTVSPGVRSTLVKALPIGARILGMSDDGIERGRAALTDASADVRIGMCFVMGQLGDKLGGALLPDMLALVKDPEASVRGAAAIALRAFATDAAAKQKFREALRPLLKDRDAQVRWAALDTLHELDPAQEPALVGEIAALLKDEDQTVRNGAVRALGAAGPAAKPHLLDIVRFFNDDPAVPPYAAAQAVGQISPLTPLELTSLLHPLFVSADLTPLTRLTAYSASGGEADGLLLIRLLGRSSAATKDVVPDSARARATALLQDALKAPLLHEKLKAEIAARIAEVQAAR